MKMIDDRIQITEVENLSDELAGIITTACEEDYNVNLSTAQINFLATEFNKVLKNFFNV